MRVSTPLVLLLLLMTLNTAVRAGEAPQFRRPNRDGIFQEDGLLCHAGGKDKHWAHPIIADGRLHIRHGDTLTAYRIK